MNSRPAWRRLKLCSHREKHLKLPMTCVVCKGMPLAQASNGLRAKPRMHKNGRRISTAKKQKGLTSMSVLCLKYMYRSQPTRYALYLKLILGTAIGLGALAPVGTLCPWLVTTTKVNPWP